ncbi:MAG: septum formation initiator family protein [Actinomycetota bacterium]|nr:septum formation initiator family protein [Actinomycetota bacterium]
MTDQLIREEQAAQPAGTRPKRSGWRTVLFVSLLVVFGLVVSGVLPLQQYLERENQVNAAIEDLAALESANASLNADVSALQSDQELERVAREQYGFVREGEIGYVVTTPDIEESPRQGAAPTPVEVKEAQGFFGKIWQFLSGGDVVEDG